MPNVSVTLFGANSIDFARFEFEISSLTSEQERSNRSIVCKLQDFPLQLRSLVFIFRVFEEFLSSLFLCGFVSYYGVAESTKPSINQYSERRGDPIAVAASEFREEDQEREKDERSTLVNGRKISSSARRSPFLG